MRIIDEVERGAGNTASAVPADRHQQSAQGGRWANFWRRLHTSRELRHLTDEDLADIGLTRAEAEREAHLSPWKML